MGAANITRLLCAALLAFALVASGCTATASSDTQAPAPVAAEPTASAAATSPAPAEAPAEAAPAETPSTFPGRLIAARVTRVVDGDTVVVRFASGLTEKVRLIGIDTPESTTEHEPYGEQASAFAKRELDDRDVWLEKDVEERDRYGRLLAYVWTAKPTARTESEVRKKMFNARLVIEGYAGQYTFPPNVMYAEYFGSYASQARKADKGLWSVPGGASAVEHGSSSSGSSGSSGGSTSSASKPSAPSESGYVANSNTGKFHEAGCSSVDDMNPANKVFYGSRDAAAGAGYVPCKRCNP